MKGNVTTGQTSKPRTVIEVLGLTLATFIVAIIAGIVFIVPMVALGYDIQTTYVLVGATAASQIAMFGLGYAYLRYRDLTVSIMTPNRFDVGYVIGGVLAALITAVALSALLVTFDLLPGSVISETATTNPTYLLGLAALSVLIVAPVEEFVFRGVIQRRLRNQFGPVPAIIGASLLFGSMHLVNYTGNPVPIIAGALLISSIGAIFGAVYERTENLFVPVLVHAIYNVILLVTSYLATTSL
ncbi:MAG: CPBP family intramembrane glutamic endopeptidase [Halobacteriota archaeon]